MPNLCFSVFLMMNILVWNILLKVQPLSKTWTTKFRTAIHLTSVSVKFWQSYQLAIMSVNGNTCSSCDVYVLSSVELCKLKLTILGPSQARSVPLSYNTGYWTREHTVRWHQLAPFLYDNIAPESLRHRRKFLSGRRCRSRKTVNAFSITLWQK